MRVLILSTYERTGGAAIAANRLRHALEKEGVNVTMLCRRNIGWWPKGWKPQSWSSIAERALIFLRNGLSMKDLWGVDTALVGQDITRSEAFRKADVVHLHWVNQGFLSLGTIARILRSGKRVVWTMHDEWPLDGIVHYADTVGTDSARRLNALNNSVMERKRRVYAQGRITFVTCSRWLKGISEVKPLAQGQEIVSIPNAIDTDVFKPADRLSLREEFGLPKDRKVVLFVSQKVTDERKGVRYLDEATAMLGDDVRVVALGRDIPYIYDEEKMARLYAACDVFVTPSLQDNLPNTIMEAMACGTPCVGFNVGGIPEMIDHRVNGYVARYKDAADLACGINYVLGNGALGAACREKVMREYSEHAVARRYMEIFSVDS